MGLKQATINVSLDLAVLMKIIKKFTEVEIFAHIHLNGLVNIYGIVQI